MPSAPCLTLAQKNPGPAAFGKRQPRPTIASGELDSGVCIAPLLWQLWAAEHSRPIFSSPSTLAGEGGRASRPGEGYAELSRKAERSFRTAEVLPLPRPAIGVTQSTLVFVCALATLSRKGRG